ncbi:ABC transporter permease [Peptoniphilus sp. KCTC 25270]|uniref:ABC transporter permease n=1 Tax=Peptoniphilus sp. KCTC 25270 TaxID=2897414 RepID=UPI001E39171D|nr:ABC transporter permease [Peptoniphilus sp. KCTC 25270]MCD1148012.1 ABC transporter permease [Peptoniphilus sp. KCTC 25270]
MKSKKLYYTLMSILMGFVVGAIILIAIGINPLLAYKEMILGAFGQPKYISWTIVEAVPIILTGIAVAFAFNTGVFNIGAEGQFIVGALVAALIGVNVTLPPVIHALVCIAAAILAGGIWGGLVGLFKAKRGVNEVISCIMLNWIAFYFSNYMLTKPFLRKPDSNYSFDIQDSASIRILGEWKRSEAGREILKEMDLLRNLLNPPVHWGILIAILVAIIAWYILKKTTLGYQLKAVGFNRYAAEYGGINISKNIITSMAISGAIAGLAGGINVLGVSENIGLLASQQGYGFNGIAVSLIAVNNPLACIPAGILFAGLNYGGGKLNSRLNTPSEIINILIGVIVLFIAMPKLLEIIRNFGSKKKGGEMND